MINYLKQYRFYINLFLLTLIPIITIDTSTRSPREYRFYDRAIVVITSPIQTTINWFLEQLTLGIENYIYLWNTRKDNTALLKENRRLLNSISILQEMRQENIRLRKFLNFQEKFQFKSIVARVIAKDVSTEFRSIRINRGEAEGIRKKMAVLTDEGIVGHVLRTTRHTSDIVTILDLLSAVDAIVERSRVRGVVEGLTDEVCRLKYTTRTDDVQVGDTLVSSGLGGIFPKGLMIGKVSKTLKKPYGISQEIEVQPHIDFSRLEEVLVVDYGEVDP